LPAGRRKNGRPRRPNLKRTISMSPTCKNAG
jgi:hypothetical protein